MNYDITIHDLKIIEEGFNEIAQGKRRIDPRRLGERTIWKGDFLRYHKVDDSREPTGDTLIQFAVNAMPHFPLHYNTLTDLENGFVIVGYKEGRKGTIYPIEDADASAIFEVGHGRFANIWAGKQNFDIRPIREELTALKPEDPVKYKFKEKNSRLHTIGRVVSKLDIYTPETWGGTEQYANLLNDGMLILGLEKRERLEKRLDPKFKDF